MCLLIVVSRCSDAPLVVGANRDELHARPAVPVAVLREAEPRIVGGRDQVAGGTWFAVNESGVVAGLTNRRPIPGVQPTKRSRGELPVAVAQHRSAAAAVEGLAKAYRPSDYNPAWLLVGDRDDLFVVDMTDGDVPGVEALPPGVHILENLPPGEPSAKIAHVRARLGDVHHRPLDELLAVLEAVLADHTPTDSRGPSSAGCVHGDLYGTRWSGIVTVPADTSRRPTFRYADGPPCRAPFVDASRLWSGGA